jgi:hypothetical protein
MAEGVGFEPTREQNPLPVFKTGALNHSATLPNYCTYLNFFRFLQAMTGVIKRRFLPFFYRIFPAIAAFNAASSLATASSCIPGITWL